MPHDGLHYILAAFTLKTVEGMTFRFAKSVFWSGNLEVVCEMLDRDSRSVGEIRIQS